MNRLRDYLGFAVQFIGLGYIALWPVSTPARGDLFGASLICDRKVASALDLICRMPHPLRLGVGLHAFGALCAVLATLLLLLRAVGRALRRRGAVSDPAAPSAPVPAVAVETAAAKRPRRRRPPPPRKLVRARTQFGLRGVPQ